MADEIRALSAELARDPASLVFVTLAELLRTRGQLDAARKVVQAGLARHPALAEAHDLHARILSDAGDIAGAEREWLNVLQIEERHLGARKGLGFVRFRQGDIDGALDHLEVALSVDPTDPAVVQALLTVRAAAEQAAGAVPPADPPAAPVAPESRRFTDAVFTGLEGADQGLLLVDSRGLVLGGGIQSRDGKDASEAVAAHLAGVTQEAERTARILDLGDWLWMVAEMPEGTMYLSQPTAGTALLLVRDRSVPSGRLAVIAEKATAVAHRWLEGQQP
jgi:predicted regulator of Ras-like GTPase activity (Roadblock/LC7/MglB family)